MKNSKIVYVDVGAANAVDPRFKGLLKAGKLSYVGFEPDARSPLEFPGQVYPVAVGSKSEVRTLNLCRKPEVSSFLKPNMEFLLQDFHNPERFEVVDTVEVRVHPMDDYFEVNSTYILKIDVQGFELEVLRGAQRMLQNTVAVELEVEFQEMYEGQPLFGEISAFLAARGFRFEDFTKLVHWPRKSGLGPGILVFGQALFVRERSSFRDLRLASKTEALSLALQTFGREDLIASYSLPNEGAAARRLRIRYRLDFWFRELVQHLTRKQWVVLHFLDRD